MSTVKFNCQLMSDEWWDRGERISLISHLAWVWHAGRCDWGTGGRDEEVHQQVQGQQPADVSKSVSVSVPVLPWPGLLYTVLEQREEIVIGVEWGVSPPLCCWIECRSKSISCQVSHWCQVCECEGGEGEGDSSGVRNVIISLSSLFTIQIKKLAMAV